MIIIINNEEVLNSNCSSIQEALLEVRRYLENSYVVYDHVDFITQQIDNKLKEGIANDNYVVIGIKGFYIEVFNSVN